MFFLPMYECTYPREMTNNVCFLMLLLKRSVVIPTVRLGSNALLWFVSWRTGYSCQQFLSGEMKYVSALYRVTVSKWDSVTWIPDNFFGCCHLLSVTFKSVIPYAKMKRSPWQLCIQNFIRRSKTYIVLPL